MSTLRFDPATYPGWRPDGPVQLTADGLRPLPPDRQEGGLSSLVWSLAHGSNACPDRLRDKGFGEVGAMLLPARIAGYRTAWEARRSRTGAVPLTLVRDADAVETTWLLGLPESALPALEASEVRGHNYHLAVLGDVVACDRWLVTDVPGWAPGPATRVLAADGVPLTWPDADQAAAQAALEAVTGEADTLPVSPLARTLDEGWPRTSHRPLPLFVYGSLRPGASRWPVVADAVEVVGEAAAVGRLHDTGRGWPAAVFDPGAHRVHGVLLQPTGDGPGLLRELDAIEGHPTLFRRRALQVVDPAGRPTWSVAYEWNVAHQGALPGDPLPDGRWAG